MSMVQTITNIGESGLELVTSTDLSKKCARRYTTSATLPGAHGYTAHFWMMYMGYINLFHRFEKAIQAIDLELFSYTLTPVIDLFFATTHVNQSHWLTKHQMDLLNIDDTHPGLKESLH